jgi:hypothetical protein
MCTNYGKFQYCSNECYKKNYVYAYWNLYNNTPLNWCNNPHCIEICDGSNMFCCEKCATNSITDTIIKNNNMLLHT